MKSNDFLNEVSFDPLGGSQQQQPVSSQAVRMTFLKDFVNDALVSIDTAVKTGIINLKAAGTAPAADQTQNTQTTQQTPTTAQQQQEPKPRMRQDPSTGQWAQAPAVSQTVIDALKKMGYKQQEIKNLTANIDPKLSDEEKIRQALQRAPMLAEDVFDTIKKFYLNEQESGVTSLSNYIEDFFNDYVKAAKANYTNYQPQIKKLSQEIAQEYIKNPRGKFGIGYSKPLREKLTQLGDLALIIYKQKRGTQPQQPVVPAGQIKQQQLKTADPALSALAGEYNIDLLSPEQQVAATRNNAPTDDKLKNVKSAIANLSPREKLMLKNFIMQTMPAAQDLSQP